MEDFYRAYFNDLVTRLRGIYIDGRREDWNREADIIGSGRNSRALINIYLIYK